MHYNDNYFYQSGYSFFSFFLYFPVYDVIPDAALGNTYNINTRTTNISGDVYYYDVDGDLKLAPDITIVNEGDNYYYNPVTDTTYDFSDWAYDYSDRSYTLTLENGDTTTITYGDEYITIEEGDTVYNIYYYVPDDTGGAPEPHIHEWYQTGASQATCTDYGTKTYTCSTCGEQKTDVLPALGHNWVQSGFVPAEYDDDGNVLEKAYILYTCSRCDEEYRDYDGVGPPEPPPAGGDDEEKESGLLAWLEKFKAWLGEKLDALTGGGDLVLDGDVDLTYTDEDGENKSISVLGIIAAFAWWKQVADIGKTFVSQVSASEAAAYAYDARAGGNPTGAPSIPIDLGAAQSPHGAVYGGQMEMLDLSWYTPYKKTVDDLVSGFLWLFFLWALFRHAPAVISGVGLTASRSSDIAQGHKGRGR